MAVYKKLAEARIELQSLKLKKTGVNKYSGFTYYELGDYLPAINEICAKKGIATQFSIIPGEYEKAVLQVVDTDSGETVDFISPTAEARIGVKKDGTGGADPIQNLGGKITYMRRYMLMTAFEMVESDMVDSIKREVSEAVSESHVKEIKATKTIEQLRKVCAGLKSKYKVSLITPLYEAQEQVINQNTSKA